MKRFLLIIAASIGTSLAQSDAPPKSAFGDGTGVNGDVRAVVVQPDGKIVIGGKFSEVNGVPRNNLARLNADGSLDRSFADKEVQGVNGQVSALALQPGGGIIVGGLFTQAAEFETMNLARYNADGTIDRNFGGLLNGAPGTNGEVLALAVQADGKILVGGNFSTAFGQQRRSIARLNTDGTLDGILTDKNAMLNGAVKALATASDDSGIAGGMFTVQNQDARSLFKVVAPQQ